MHSIFLRQFWSNAQAPDCWLQCATTQATFGLLWKPPLLQMDAVTLENTVKTHKMFNLIQKVILYIK